MNNHRPLCSTHTCHHTAGASVDEPILRYIENRVEKYISKLKWLHYLITIAG